MTSVPQITALSIGTCDRLPTLLRCLESFIRHAQRYKRPLEYVIFDDSAAVASRVALRQALSGLKATYDASIYYAGLEEKQAFAELLAQESGVPREVIDFSLFDPLHSNLHFGANRNASLLHTVGEQVLCVDDDTICELYSVTNQRPDVALSSAGVPAEFWVFPQDKKLEDCAIRTERNIFESVEQLLGRTPKECAERSGQPLDQERASPALKKAAESGQGRVLFSWLGIFGDSGQQSPKYLLTPVGELRRLTLKNEALYRAAHQSRKIMVAPVKCTIGQNHLLQSTAMGLDNRDLLPPFMPVYRGEDGMFLTTLRKCQPEGFTGYLPWAIRHEPPDVRRYETDSFFNYASRVRLTSALSHLVRTAPLNEQAAGAEALNAMGRYLQSFAEGRPEDFRVRVQEAMRTIVLTQADGLTKMLEAFKRQPAFWAQDVDRYVALLTELASAPDLLMPEEFLDQPDPAAAFQRMVQEFGRLLTVWPSLIQASKKLRLQGRRLAKEIV